MKSDAKVNKLVPSDRQVTLSQALEQTTLFFDECRCCGAGCGSLERALCLQELRL